MHKLNADCELYSKYAPVCPLKNFMTSTLLAPVNGKDKNGKGKGKGKNVM